MNFADIEHAWQSPLNGGNSADLHSMKTKLNHELRKRRRGLAVFLVLIFLGLSALSVAIVLGMVRADGAGKSIDLSKEWGALLVGALPWIAAILFAVRFHRHRRNHEGYERSIQESILASLDENRFARMRIKTVAILHGLLLIALPLVVYQLREVGKAGDEIIVPAFVIWPVIALSIGAGLAYHYRCKLLPQQRELEEMLQSYR